MVRPQTLHKSPNVCGNIQGMLRKILVLPTQIQHPNRLHARANTTIWKVAPFKSALAHAGEEELKGLETQFAEGDIIILGGII